MNYCEILLVQLFLKVKEQWGYGKAFGQISMQTAYVNSDQFVFPAWKPWTWNSYCFIADSTNRTFKAILNKKTIYESNSYNKQHENSAMFVLMNSVGYDMAASGELSDVQIWSRKFSIEGIFNVEMPKGTKTQVVFYRDRNVCQM